LAAVSPDIPGKRIDPSATFLGRYKKQKTGQLNLHIFSPYNVYFFTVFNISFNKFQSFIFTSIKNHANFACRNMQNLHEKRDSVISFSANSTRGKNTATDKRKNCSAPFAAKWVQEQKIRAPSPLKQRILLFYHK